MYATPILAYSVGHLQLRWTGKCLGTTFQETRLPSPNKKETLGRSHQSKGSFGRALARLNEAVTPRLRQGGSSFNALSPRQSSNFPCGL